MDSRVTDRSFSSVIFPTNCYVAVFLLYFSINTYCMTDKSCFNDFPPHVLKRHISISRRLPLCVLYRRSDSAELERTFCKVWKLIKESRVKNLTAFQFGSYSSLQKPLFNIDIPSKSVIRCYLGFTEPRDYSSRIQKKSLKKWLNKLAVEHSDQLKEASLEQIKLCVSGDKSLVAVGFPGPTQHQQLEELLFKIRSKWTSHVEFMFVHPHSDHIFDLIKKYKINVYPSVLILNAKANLKIERVFEEYDVDYVKIELFFTSRLMPAKSLNELEYNSDVATVYQQYKPIIILFYGFWEAKSLPYLKALHSTLINMNDLGLQVRFGLVDVNEQAEILSKWFGGTYAFQLPFIALYTPILKKNRVGRVKRFVMLDTRPTPSAISQFLLMHNIELKNKYSKNMNYKPYKELSGETCEYREGPKGSICSMKFHNTTDNYFYESQSQPALYSNIEKMEQYNTSQHVKNLPEEQFESGLDEFYAVPLLTADDWHAVIESSHLPSPIYSPKMGLTEHSKVVLVIYVMADCSSCLDNADTFRYLRKAVSYLKGSSTYLVNCTKDVDLCNKLEVTGFPTIMAFRNSGWMLESHCFSEATRRKYKSIRIDYHGVIQVKNIMNWLSKISKPAVEVIGQKTLQPYKDSSVVAATLVPHNSRFLSNIPILLRKALYPYECFLSACERLFGSVQCVGVYSKDIPHSEYFQTAAQMVVSQVDFIRSDGLSAAIFQLGKKLVETLEDETIADLHKFHQPHRYNLKSNQKCEDDHGKCTDLIVDFINDHARLPVTLITSEMFHTKQSIFPANQPVLLALVHQHNISADAEFLQELTKSAEILYKEITVTVVDVYQYPAWAGQFVPKNYGSAIIGNDHTMSLYLHPRLCIINWNDHSHAAFYTPPHSSDASPFLAKKIIKFVSNYLKDPSSLIVETEQF